MFLSPGSALIFDLVVLLALVVGALYVLQLVLPAFQTMANALFDRLHERSRGFLRPLRGPLDTFKNDWAFVIAMGLVLLVAAFAFLYVAEDVIEGDPAQLADRATYWYMRSLRNPFGDNLLIGITEIGDAFVVTSVGIAVAVWLGVRRAWRPLACWILAIAGGSMLNTVIKAALHRSRPTDLYHQGWSAFSFPSGHSTTNAVLYGFLAILIARDLPKKWRFPLAACAACLVALIDFSRLYLGAHWLSDVVGGLAFGSVWLAATGILYVRRSNGDVGAKGLLAFVAVVIAISAGMNILMHHGHDLQFYAKRQHTTVAPATDASNDGQAAFSLRSG